MRWPCAQESGGKGQGPCNVTLWCQKKQDYSGLCKNVPALNNNKNVRPKETRNAHVQSIAVISPYSQCLTHN